MSRPGPIVVTQRWEPTVRDERNSGSAISRLEYPSAASRAIWSSWGDSASAAGVEGGSVVTLGRLVVRESRPGTEQVGAQAGSCSAGNITGSDVVIDGGMVTTT